MISHTGTFEIAVPIFVAVLLLVAGRSYFKARRVSTETWETLMARLILVDRDKIAMIATDLLRESDSDNVGQTDIDLDPAQMWELIGGLHGVEILGANCDVLIDLACYLQLWCPEALVVAERLRLGAREMKWHIGRLQGAARQGNLELAFPDYAQQAVATYYLMTRQVLALYEAVAVPGFVELQRAL